MSNSTYILQKDTLRSAIGTDIVLKAGTEFTCSGDEKYYHQFPSGWYFSADFVENNPEWFKKKEETKERVEVIFIRQFSDTSCDYQLHITSKIPEEKFPAIKQAIENTLNEEKYAFNHDALNKRLEELKDSKWVKTKGDKPSFRYVTRKINEKIFEDDGLISGLPSSPSCRYDSYIDVTQGEELLCWAKYMQRQPLQFFKWY